MSGVFEEDLRRQGFEALGEASWLFVAVFEDSRFAVMPNV